VIDVLRRRAFLAAAATALAGCGGAAPVPPPAPKPDEPPPLRVPELTKLLPLAGLRWLILAAPRDIASAPGLIPAITRIAPEQNLDRFAAHTGFDLRQIPEAAIAAYAGDATLYLLRHNGDRAAIERLFRARLTSGEHRAVDRADVVRVSGKIGRTPATMVVLGGDVVAYQFGGSASRGPARIASLYARDLLKKSPTVMSEDPVKAFAVGPFEGELTRGARGLLAGATAIGGTVRPSARDGLLVVIAVAGDFSKSAEPASRELVTAWDELAGGSFGHLLGLDQPIERPLATHAADAVTVAVEIDPGKLAKGIAAATSARLEEIMR